MRYNNEYFNTYALERGMTMDKDPEMLILMADGTEEVEALTMYDVLQRGGVQVELCSITGQSIITSSHGVKITCDSLIEDVSPYDINAVFIPGGIPGALNLAAHPLVLHIVQSLAVDNKLIVAVCAGPYVLYEAGLTEGLALTCAPSFAEKVPNCDYISDAMVVLKNNFLTGNGPAACLPLALQTLEILRDAESAKKVEDAMQVSKLYSCVQADSVVSKQ